MVDRLVAALVVRIRRFAESGDPSGVLDRTALAEADELWKAIQPADSRPQAVLMEVLTVLAFLHLLRYQLLAKSQGQGDLQTAFMIFGVLMEGDPRQVPEDVRNLLSAPPTEQTHDAEGSADWSTACSKYQQVGQPGILDVAVTAFRGAVAITPPGHPDHATYLSELGSALFTRFQRDGNRTDLDAAVDAGRQAVAATPPRDPDLAKHLSNLGVSLGRRFEHTGDSTDLEAAIDAGRQAVILTAPGDPNFAGRVSSFGNSLLSRFRRDGDKADLNGAIDAAQQAVAVTPARHQSGAMYWSNLGSALLARFEQAGDNTDLEAAIRAGREALAATPPDHPDHAKYLSNLGNSLGARFDQAGDREDLDAAIDAARQAVDMTPRGHPELVGRLAILGGILLTRFDTAGDSEDLDAAIEAGNQAVALMPPAYPNRAGLFTNLGNALVARFEQAGGSADLDSAIEAGQQAVATASPGDPNRAMYLSNLGNSLGRRFERDQDVADLNAAIDVEQQAVTAAPPGYPGRAVYLSNLGNSLLGRFRRTRDSRDLDAAIDAGTRAVADISGGHAQLPATLSNLAGSLAARFEQAGDIEDLNAAIDAAQRAVTATSPGHAQRAMYLTNLGNCLLSRFWRDRDSADLDAAVSHGRKAVADCPVGHPNRAAYLSNLGASLQARFGHAGDPADLDAAIGYWRQASMVSAGRPSTRLAAARMLGALAADTGRMHEAAEGFAAAVGLLPQVAWHGLDRATREEQLVLWAGLAADAAACAVLDGRPERSVELLEQGRSVLWTQSLNLRSDLTRLAEQAPELAGRLNRIRVILDSPLPEANQPLSDLEDHRPSLPGRMRQQKDAAELRRQMARDWDEVLAQVRALEGFEHFLAAIPYPELAAAGADGPIVIVNVSRYGCHALIVDADTMQPRVVDLHRLNLDACVGHANRMLTALASAAAPERVFQERENDRHAILDILDWLWDVVIEPVLTTLGHTTAPGTGDSWPRVWWCPTGALTVLPIHAAGHHPRHRSGTRSIDTVLDRVISSYTPTLTALIRARQPLPPVMVRQLTVGMPITPGLPPLRAVPAELAVLAQHFIPGQDHRQLVGPQATRDTVGAAIATHSWVHLACHAGQQQADPDRSGFALWDATLTITDLAAQPTQHRDLAFLSACQTATGSTRHLDEAIHLAAAMQFLGYRYVIATMWTIADSPAPGVAENVYAILTRGRRPDASHAAEALHHAIHALRNTDPTNPLLWAPYINLGT
jgi:tetratricopeptide (TPR) repeat protein